MPLPLPGPSSTIGSVTPHFIPGLRLSELFYADVVRPLLDEEFPALTHAAALIGHGSEVLGFDTARSMDHDWGPRLQVFIEDPDLCREATAMINRRLPESYRGLPIAFPPEDRHRVVVTSAHRWLQDMLGFDPHGGVDLDDWLATPSSRFAEITQGRVFHDDVGVLTAARERLAWYPDDVWLYLLSCQWLRISQEEAFPGRCAEVGDDLGSAVVTASLTRDLMRLCLLMSRRFPPYDKWFGTAFAALPDGPSIGAHLRGAMAATVWADREQHLSRAYEAVARVHNATGLTAYLDPAMRPFHDRPYVVPEAGRFADALFECITDDRVRRLPRLGAVHQFMDSTDALMNHPAVPRAAVRAMIDSVD